MSNILSLAKKRRSVRTYDGKPLQSDDLEKIMTYARENTANPFGVPVDFCLLRAKEHGLSSPVLVGEDYYLAVKVPRQPGFEEAYGYSFEKLVLYTESINIGTVWIGGTMNREAFEKAINLTEEEVMPCVTPIGYTADQMALREKMMRKGVKADKRKDAAELFFCKDFSKPLTASDQAALEWVDASVLADALEAVRWAPSAVNKQPWRLVFDDRSVHFYEKQDKGYVSHSTGDLQQIDVGIAMCHFDLGLAEAGISLSWDRKDPGIALPDQVKYVATATV